MVSDRPLRADARRNRDRILAAAREAFAESGFAVPLDDIAARAGVGPGTVYRHFPDKSALFGAVVTARVSDLVSEARHRASDDEPGAAFFGFLTRVAQEAAAKRDLPDAIAVPGPLREALHEAMSVLLHRAQECSAVRGDITTDDLIALLKSLVTAVADSPSPGRADRILAVVVDGLRASPPKR
ncbi:helix-turn-helix transcriptional regulator [Skermania sp. ID1734]|uniref:TetR/AcrR family transcriptional regulator n=1 Tax=Skermania sp. ID1734 TaxID=2597516 RepID=UPI00117E45A2|nr:TetR/AcrR family transcriptional regulator [Skermania sp. ID1734]TSD93631.1 helix-turn-helix transcriptional regulator [Skermania sp. ID1734]